MNIAPCPAQLIKNARERCRWTQYQLAEFSGISRGRISHFERGLRTPDSGEQEVLVKLLDICEHRLRESAPVTLRPVLPSVRRRFGPRDWLLRVPRDRESNVRYWSAQKKCPRLVRELNECLMERADLDWVRVFLREACFDSYLEILFAMRLLAVGAKPGWLAPQHTGFCELPILHPQTRLVTGHLLYPAMALDNVVLFPQVCVRARNVNLILDCLVGVRRKKSVDWYDFEIDGHGHDASQDHLRETELPFPVVRFRREDVVGGGMLHRINELAES